MIYIGDKIKRVDYNDPVIYEIDKIVMYNGIEHFHLKEGGWVTSHQISTIK